MKFFAILLLTAALVLRAATYDEILDRSAHSAEREALFLASIACTEAVVETKFGPKDKAESRVRRQFDYFVMVDTSDGDLSVNESRIEQGKEHKGGKQLLQSTGFALLALVFHPFFQESFTMGDEGLERGGDGLQWRKISFRYRPGKRSPTLLRTGSREYPIGWQGQAWIDEQSGRIGRIHATAEAQLEEIGIKTMEADVRYGPAVNLKEPAGWAPLEAVVDLRTPHQHWRNTHTFSGFRKFEVSSEEKGTKTK